MQQQELHIYRVRYTVCNVLQCTVIQLKIPDQIADHYQLHISIAAAAMIKFGKQLDASRPCSRQEGARYALLVLTAVNLLNYADRYVPSAVKELIKDDLNLSDTETTYPTTGMIFVYMIFAGIFGYVADKDFVDRRYILAGSVVLWSLATALAGLAQNLTQLVLFRSLVGVGEAAYSTIAPPMLSDYFPHADRNIAYAIYYLAIPVGGALGFAIGSVLGGSFGWRVAFLGVGLPGVAAAACVLLINNPVVGINDPDKIRSGGASVPMEGRCN